MGLPPIPGVWRGSLHRNKASVTRYWLHRIHRARIAAQFIEAAWLRIMGETDGIDNVEFHQLDIFSHQFFRHIMPGFGLVLMQVDPF